MKIQETSIKGLFIIKNQSFTDDRGFFREVYRDSELQDSAIHFKPIQMNHSRSTPGVIRALHAENWNKLVYPVSGKMFAAIVDIRPNSKTFGKCETFNFDNTLGHSEHIALFITQGLANSICVNGSETVDYIYLVDAYYDGKDTTAIAWDDPDLNINWPVKSPIISVRDTKNPKLRELFPEKFK